MNRKLKALGLALVAVFAMSAVAASGAQATNFFHNHLGSLNPDNVIITGENKIGTSGTVSTHEITLAPGSEAIKCSSAVFEGTETAGASHVVTDKSLPFTHTGPSSIKTITGTNLTVTPTLSNCTVGGGAATLSTTGCHFRFTSETTAGLGGVHIECDAGKIITMSGAGCKIEIGTQTPTGGGVTYTNETSVTSTRDIKLKTAVGGITYTTNGAFACFLWGIGSGGSAGEYKGEMTDKAFTDNEATATGTYSKGAQVGYWWGPTE